MKMFKSEKVAKIYKRSQDFFFEEIGLMIDNGATEKECKEKEKDFRIALKYLEFYDESRHSAGIFKDYIEEEGTEQQKQEIEIMEHIVEIEGI